MGDTKTNFVDIDLTDVKGVLIDIDDTLYSYQPSHEVALEKCTQKYLSLSLDKPLDGNEFKKRYREKRSSVTDRLSPQGACRSRFFAFQELFEDLELNAAYQFAQDFEELYWSSFVEIMKPSDEAVAFLVRCKKASVKVCAVSDMLASFQVSKLKRLELVEHIDFLVTSEEVGAEKPSSKMFSTALKKLKLSASEVIMIGDHPAKDVSGAESVGIKAYQVSLND